jgi:hypothetical protein
LAPVRERHATYHSALVQRLDPAAPTTLLSFSGEGEALGRSAVYEVLQGLHDNIRVALRWWLDLGRAIEALTLLRALGPLWIAVGPKGVLAIEAVLDLAAANGVVHKRCTPRR